MNDIILHMKDTVVLMKTCTWSLNIEEFAKKIYNDTRMSKIDFFILMHGDSQVNDDSLKDIIIKFTEEEIKGIYQVGFFSMWLSNHWILMWFYRKFNNYKYYWSFEYDVRISGNSNLIWNYNGSYDLLYPRGNYRNTNNKYKECYIGGKLTPLQKFYGYLQISRYSNRALKYLDKCFEEGENGQDELIIFSLLNRGGFTGSKIFLRSLVKGIWTWESMYSDYNKSLYNKANSVNQLSIFHPVK